MSENLPHLSANEREAVERIASYDREQLKEWKRKLKEAQTQVTYWENQSNASGAVAIRITLSKP